MDTVAGNDNELLLSESAGAQRYLDRLGGRNGSNLESAGSPTLDLSSGRISMSVEALESAIGQLDGGDLSPEECVHLVSCARRAMSKLSNDGADSALSGDEQQALEAIILSDGSRPVLFVQDNNIDLTSPDLGAWKGRTRITHAGIKSIVRSVGRINDPGSPLGYCGTGFVIGDGVVVTNRHVLEEIGMQIGDQWTLRDHLTIDFGCEFERDTQNEYQIQRVLYAGPDRIDRSLNLSNLDVAILETSTGSDYPATIELLPVDAAINKQESIYVCGFPGRPRGVDPTVLERLFQSTFSFKRWAPGRITDLSGTLSGDEHSRVIGHDATTLGGNSGSAVVRFSGTGLVGVALHFGGLTGSLNYAHDVNKLRDVFSTLPL